MSECVCVFSMRGKKFCDSVSSLNNIRTKNTEKCFELVHFSIHFHIRRIQIKYILTRGARWHTHTHTAHNQAKLPDSSQSHGIIMMVQF